MITGKYVIYTKYFTVSKIERTKKVKTSKESVVKQVEVKLSEAKQSLADISAEIVILTEQLDRIQ